MDNQQRQARCQQVQVTMKKLGRAYASERINMKLYRDQRALLIDYLLHEGKIFPKVILNQEAQSLTSEAQQHQFNDEPTPVLDDLGFAQNQGPLPVIGPTKNIHNRLNALETSNESSSSPPDYYWFFLIFFIVVLSVLAILIIF